MAFAPHLQVAMIRAAIDRHMRADRRDNENRAEDQHTELRLVGGRQGLRTTIITVN